MHLLKRRLELLVPGIFTVGLFFFECFSHFGNFGQRLVDQIFPWLTLVFLCAIGWQLIRLEGLSVQRALVQLLADYGRDDPYVKDWIQSAVAQLRTTLQSNAFETASDDESCEQLCRALRMCRAGDSVSTISYRPVWHSCFDPFLTALELVSREDGVKDGVHVTHIFVIPEELKDLTDTAKRVWKLMTDQAKKGIEVMYIEEAHVPDTQSFQVHYREMVEFRYGARGCITMHEIPSKVPPGQRRKPLLFRVSWQESEIADGRAHLERMRLLRNLQAVDRQNNPATPPWTKKQPTSKPSSTGSRATAASEG